jgi:hypothetical protein
MLTRDLEYADDQAVQPDLLEVGEIARMLYVLRHKVEGGA